MLIIRKTLSALRQSPRIDPYRIERFERMLAEIEEETNGK
jgi:hypothetical protein